MISNYKNLKDLLNIKYSNTHQLRNTQKPQQYVVPNQPIINPQVYNDYSRNPPKDKSYCNPNIN